MYSETSIHYILDNDSVKDVRFIETKINGQKFQENDAKGNVE